MMLAGLAFSNTVCSYYEIDTEWMHYVGGTSILTLTFLYMASYVFKFCEYHRMFLHYVFINWLLTAYDTHIGIPISDRGYFCLQLCITGVTLFIILYLYVKSTKGTTN